jgi:hypothetical protein
MPKTASHLLSVTIDAIFGNDSSRASASVVKNGIIS